MTIALLLLPYLVYDIVVRQLDLNDRISLAVLSKRTRWIVRRSFAKRPFKLEINDNNTYILTPDVGSDLTINLCTILGGDLTKYPVWKHVLIPQEDHRMNPKEALKKHVNWNVFPAKLTQFLVYTFSNLAITMTLYRWKGNLHSSAEVIKNSNVPIDHMMVRCENPNETIDILLNCVTVKTLQIYGDLQDPTAILPSLQCDDVEFEGLGCCAEQIVRVFMNCKRFVHSLNYSCSISYLKPDALVLIFEAWKNGSRLEYMKLKCKEGAYQKVKTMMPGTSKKFKYEDEARDCYLIDQVNGKEAVIYSTWSMAIELTTDFELVGDQ